MFTNLNFNEYSQLRLEYYKKLAQFKIEKALISDPITIDESFFERISSHFQTFLTRRLETQKFSTIENKTYKKLLKENFPEILPIFEHSGPAVYWFTMHRNNELSNEDILNHYSLIKKGNSGWWTQVNLNRKHSTDTLYLGKIEGSLQNRFIQHIGLGHNYTTALKLQHWVPSLDKSLNLTFQFLSIPDEMKLYLEDIENVLWKECKPLLGAPPRIKD